VHALVVGGGRVGTRKALALFEAGAHVKVIAPTVSIELRDLSASNTRLTLERREYIGPEDLLEFEIIFAATDSHELNATIAEDARRLRRLVNVASDGSEGSFTSMAVHREGRLTIGVSAGGVPAAAASIRNEIAQQFDGRYAKMIEQLFVERVAMDEASR
jgi:precorrin-2 dehydrogenase / sirohydrochlorin ferrochelatase